MKTAQNVLEVQLSDVKEVEVYFSKLAFCATFNGTSLHYRQLKMKVPMTSIDFDAYVHGGVYGQINSVSCYFWQCIAGYCCYSLNKFDSASNQIYAI